MRFRIPVLVTVAVILTGSCGPEETVVLPDSHQIQTAGTCPYQWRQGDGWAFIAWAIDMRDGAEALAIRSGYSPDQIPQPGEQIDLPLPEELSRALELRLDAARLVREATELLEAADTVSVCRILQQAMETDPTWSVPAYDYSLILVRTQGPDAVLDMLEPWSHKYDAALVQSEIAWNRGDTDEALHQLEISLMDQNPPFEALAAAALIYTVTGNHYQASVIWRQILASPDATAEVRLMAARYAIMQEERQQLLE